ncbi:MAG: glycosyltransferase family 2 protein [Candidatus Thermoplasmatota archaeon]|nr:glycosyltransferase family 2 protein [Candidatus Thermoplasmatota archaeon]
MSKSKEGIPLNPKLGIGLWFLAAVFFVVLFPVIVDVSNTWDIFTIYATISWSFGMPILIMSFIGALRSRNIKISSYSGKIPNLTIFEIPTIGSYNVIPALTRVVNSILLHAPKNLENWRIDIVTEEWAEALNAIKDQFLPEGKVNLVVVPKEYKTITGSINKSRALQYAVEYHAGRGENREDIWFFHLDDDAAVGSDTVAAIAEHIQFKGSKYYIAQGILAFPHQLSRSLIVKFADSMRPSDDLTRFYFFTALLRTPLVGLHGENLLIRSDIESEIGWENGSRQIIDDSCFGLRFSEKYWGKSSFLPAFTYGASPSSVRDMLRQRRRWLVDMTNLGIYGPLPWKYRLMLIYSAMFWSSMITQNIILATLLLQFFHIISFELITPPMGLMWAFTFSFWIWFYWNGLHINTSVSENTMPFWKSALLMIPLFFFVIGPLEAIGGIMGIYAFLRNEKRFEVIQKPL